MFEIKLKAVAVSKKLKEYKEIKSLMCRAFPKNEQIPMWLLHILAIRKSVEFSAYYDEDLFCGISYTVSNEELLFILYLAVTTLIVSKKPGNTGKSRNKDTEFTTHLLHSEGALTRCPFP